jgi:hypothetical protein
VLVPRTKYRHGSAAPLAGLITLRPLHSLPHPLHRLRGSSRSFRRPQTAETGKDSGAPKIPEAARLRPAKKSELARDAAHGQNIGITARGCACRRGRGSNREIGHFRTASISQATLRRTETTDLTLADQFCLTPRRQAAGRSAERALAPIASQPTPYALPSWSQRIGCRAGATTPGTMRPRRKLKSPARRGWHEGTADATLLTALRGWASALLPGHSHNTFCV